MKYMGSKRAMLRNGLGEAIRSEITKANRFYDLFTGSGSVAWFVSSQWNIPVIACDLQHYAVSLAEGVVGRTTVINSLKIFESWINDARLCVYSSPIFYPALKHHKMLFEADNTLELCESARYITSYASEGAVTKAYGGYYFSPIQSLWLDALRATLPSSQEPRVLALASLIRTASRIAAAPGHTAQPFKPNETAGPYLIEAWKRDLIDVLSSNIIDTGRKAARIAGSVVQGDAIDISTTLTEGDLAFVDPPYSAVHYSRFYHVLETVSSGESFIPEGSGRYPPTSSRPKSVYSIKTQARQGFIKLCENLSNLGVGAIITYPEYKTSVGLSGSDIEGIAEHFFRIQKKSVSTNFSTLGGSGETRQARKLSGELILILRPR